MTVIKQMRNAAMLAALAVGHSMAMAQSTPVLITYGPADVASVPTLSEWGMIVMSVMLVVAAVIALRKGAGSKTVLSLALAASGVFGAGLGHTWLLQDAEAIAPGMTSPIGGTVPGLSEGHGIVPIFNQTNVRQRIISVEPQLVRDRQDTTCKPGTVVEPTASCDVDTGSNG